jgi:hypothetical protein
MPTPPAGAPAIPPRVRTVAYFAGLAVGGLTTLVTGVTAAVAPDVVGTVLAVCGAVNGAVLTVCGGLGVAFRPTAGLPRPVPGATVRANLVAASEVLSGGGAIIREASTITASDGSWSLTLTPISELAAAR